MLLLLSHPRSLYIYVYIYILTHSFIKITSSSCTYVVDIMCTMYVHVHTHICKKKKFCILFNVCPNAGLATFLFPNCKKG